ASRDRKHEEIVILSALVGAVDDARSVGRPVGTCTIERFFPPDHRGFCHPQGFSRHSPESAGTQGDAVVRKENNLLAVRRPRGLDVQVLPAEVEPILAIVVGRRQSGQLARLAIRNRHHEDVEPSVVTGGDVGDSLSVRRPDRVHVDISATRERAGCTGRKIKNPQTDISRIVFGCVDDPSTIRRPGGRGIVGGSGRQLARSCCAQSYLPNRPLHGESDFFSIWRPGRIPGSGRGRRQIVIVHVIASRLGRRESGRNLTAAACSADCSIPAQSRRGPNGELLTKTLCSTGPHRNCTIDFRKKPWRSEEKCADQCTERLLYVYGRFWLWSLKPPCRRPLCWS